MSKQLPNETPETPQPARRKPTIIILSVIVLLLMFFFQFGKYSCITCQGVSHGFGIYLGLIAAFVYVAGSVIKWGSRPTKRAES